MDPLKLVVRYLDGRKIKGYTNDFFPNKSVFHVGKGPGDVGVEVRVDQLKAIFFVKDFEGNPDYNEHRAFKEGQSQHGRKVMMTFNDGEMLSGTVFGYDPNRPGFFLIPSDPDSNNLRIFVVQAAVDQFEFF
jgi:hypothetical protein